MCTPRVNPHIYCPESRSRESPCKKGQYLFMVQMVACLFSPFCPQYIFKGSTRRQHSRGLSRPPVCPARPLQKGNIFLWCRWLLVFSFLPVYLSWRQHSRGLSRPPVVGPSQAGVPGREGSCFKQVLAPSYHLHLCLPGLDMDLNLRVWLHRENLVAMRLWEHL